jgi:hopanoid biosynthesis associated RND transporter like protein HpnN
MSFLQKFFRAILLRVARLAHAQPVGIVVGAIVLTLLSAWFTATHFRVINSTADLIRKDSPVQRNYLTYKKEFGYEEEIVILIRSDQVEQNRAVARRLGERLNEMKPAIARVTARFDFSRMEKRFLMFLSEKELKEIEEEVSGYAKAIGSMGVKLDVNSMLSEANKRFDDKELRKRGGFEEFKPFVARFVDQLNQLANELEGKNKPKAPAVPSGEGSRVAAGKMEDMREMLAANEYATFDDGKLLIVAAMPGRLEENSTSPYTEMLKKIRAIIQETAKEFPAVKLELTGEPVLADDELVESEQDSLRATALAFGLIALLFFFSYHELTRPALALGTLVMALTWSLGLTFVAVGHLNIISQAFVVMVLGLGIDFGIQVMGRYEEELARGATVLQALEEALQHTGLAVVMGASTTAAAFYTMCFNDFIGLSEFGIIAGNGILLCLVANLVVLPACYVWRDRNRASEKLKEEAASSHWQAGPWLNRWLFQSPAPILIGALVATAAAGWEVGRVTFDYNLLHLQNPKLESVRSVQQLLKEHANSVVFAASTADNVEEARKKVAEFRKRPEVGEVHSLTDMLPEGQEKKLVIVKRIVRALDGLQAQGRKGYRVNVEQAQADLDELLEKSQEGERQAKNFVGIAQQARDAVEMFNQLIPPLRRSARMMDQLDENQISQRLNHYQTSVFGAMAEGLEFLKKQGTDRGVEYEDIPVEVAERYRSAQGKILVEVYPKRDVWDREPNEQFVKAVRTVDPDVTGTPIMNYEYIELLRSSYVQAAGWAFLAIVVLITIHFGRLSSVLLTLLPLGLAIWWTLGIMGFCGIQFNPANIITLPLVIGIGVAFGVYTVDRWREDAEMDLFSNSTGKSIILSATTTIIGFGALTTSSYHGLASLGLIMAIGCTMCMISSVIVLPQLLRILPQSKA